MEQTHRDYNLVAKIFLTISMAATVVAIITNIKQIQVNSYLGYSNSLLIYGIIINTLILTAGILTFCKKRIGLILLVLLFFVRLFSLYPHTLDVSYSYFLGKNSVLLIRDFLPFAIAMCFKKDGLSGWKSMLRSLNSEENIDNEIFSTKEQLCEQVVEQRIDVSTYDFNQEQQQQPTSEERDNKPAVLEDTEVQTQKDVEAPRFTNDSDNNWDDMENDSVSHKGIWIGAAFATILILGLFAFIKFKPYPSYINRFGDKFRYTFNMPNNRLANVYFEKYQKARDNGLDELSIEYLNTSKSANPSDLIIIDSLAHAYFSLGYQKEDTCYYSSSKELCLSILEKKPDNIRAKKGLGGIFYNTGKQEEAYKIAEQILFDNPQDSWGIKMMCRKYYKCNEWDNLTKWGRIGYNLNKKNEEWGDISYFYAYGLYKQGYTKKAAEIYTEAESVAYDCNTHDILTLAGGIPCSISSVLVGNYAKNGREIDEPGSPIYDDDTRYLCPVVLLQGLRTGKFTFGVKIYVNGELSKNIYESPEQYTYQTDVLIVASEKDSTVKLSSWGREEPGSWKSGKYRVEIWWEGTMLYMYSFNIYSYSRLISGHPREVTR